MGAVVSLAAIAQHPMWSGDAQLELSEDPASAERFWSAILLMADREGATAVRYRPWLPISLVLVVREAEYEVFPPPAGLSGYLHRVARQWATGPGAGGVLRRWACRLLGFSVAGALTADGPDGPREWIVVCWRAGRWRGVEFFRQDFEPAGPG